MNQIRCMDNLKLFFGDNRSILPTLDENSVDCVLTSPPYWGLRDYGTGPDQLGLEPTWQLFIKHMVEISSLIKRVLKPTGSYYLVMGDTYAGSGQGHKISEDREAYKKYNPNLNFPSRRPMSNVTKNVTDNVTKPKQLLLIPSRLAIALQEDGWTLRNKIIWYKPNHMPSSVKDRLTNSYEEIFHFVQNRKYYYDLDSIREPHQSDALQRALNPNHLYGTGEGTGETGHQGFGADVKGKNPGDTITKMTSEDYEVGGMMSPQKRADLLGIPGGAAMNHPAGKNPSDFFKSNTKPYPSAHFAVFPEDICIPRIKSSCPENGTVLDPFAGTGTTGKVALDLGLKAILIEINKNYRELIERRLSVHNPEWLEKYAISDAKDNGIIPLSEW